MMFDDEPRQSLGVLFHVGLAFVLVGLFVAFVEFLVDVAVPYIMAHRPTWWQAVGTFVAFGTGLIIGSLIVRRLAARRARIESVKRKIEDAARQRRY